MCSMVLDGLPTWAGSQSPSFVGKTYHTWSLSECGAPSYISVDIPIIPNLTMVMTTTTTINLGEHMSKPMERQQNQPARPTELRLGSQTLNDFAGTFCKNLQLWPFMSYNWLKLGL